MAVLTTTSPSPSTSAPSARPTNDRPSSSTRAACRRRTGGDSAIDDGGGVGAVDLPEQHLDPLRARGGDVLADVVGPNRQLAMAAVDQDHQLDRPRAPELDQGVHRRAHGAAVPDDVVDQDHDLAVDGGDARRWPPGRGALAAVVTVTAGVERAHLHTAALKL